MVYNLRALLVVAMVVFQIGCAQAPAPQSACGYVQNSEGQRVSWKSQPQINMYFDANFPSQYYSTVQTAMGTWEAAIGHKLFNIVGTLPASQPSQDGNSVMYWMQTWDPNSTQQQANTTIYWSDNRITEADLKIDAANFQMSLTPDSDQVDLQSLVVHELGHVLGLKHDDAETSVMATSLASGFLRRTLYSADLASVKCEY